ncbi:hypothetical protein Bca4012_010216 [Brassica carinata]
MEETMIGDDLEVMPSSAMQRELTLRRLQDEVEYMRIRCDKISRSDKAKTERLSSVEKHIATMLTETSTRFGALDSQMSSITQILARIEANSVINQRSGKEIASPSQNQHTQVPIPLSELAQAHTQLGYRGINDTLANRETMFRKVDMHVFSGPLSFDWILRVERFF